MLNVLKSMPTRGKVILGASVLVTLVIVFMLFRMATAPSYTTVASGIATSETGKVTTALDEAGIPYQLTNNGTAVEVPTAQTPQAKVALGTAGIDGNQQPGYDLLDKQKLGSSDFQQKVNYQRALEGEIAN
ncbi:MAG: hypothetical protein JHC95_23850, partial [Solirubrobacteraceae bacterium]|nr:hypothetical protein [Solirubrobacteraceae bacterium]